MLSATIRSQLKQKFRERKQVFGGWHSLFHPSITEAFTKAQFDFLGIDLEHSTISQEQSQRIIATSQAGGIPCLPRIASHNGEMIKRLLDSGADGIIVPMVSTSQEVEQIIAWSKYFPAGKRSFGVARAQGYGIDYDEYTKNWNSSSSIIIQIETIQGVENIERLLNYEEIDGIMLGTYDLSGSLGIPGQLTHPKILEASQVVIAACAKYQKACGTHLVEPELKDIQQALERGFTFSVISSDVFLLGKWAEKTKKNLGLLRIGKFS